MSQRYYSLDVFRGATVALMILVNNPGSWDYLFPPLDHAPWHGCTPTDLVFPFFLFAVGNAFAFVMPKFEQKGTTYTLTKVCKRTLLIFSIGLFLNWCPFVMWDSIFNQHKPSEMVMIMGKVLTSNNNILIYKIWQNVRIMGVLQRIAICYFFAALIIYYLKLKGAFLMGCILLLVYWLVCFWLGNPNDPYSLSGYFGNEVDVKLLHSSHLLVKGLDGSIPFDPEGLASTPAAIVQVLFGYFIGYYIQTKGKTYEMLTKLFVIGVLLVCAGYCWDYVYPITKKTWTSSYTVYTTGLATLTLALLIYLIEFKNKRSVWSNFFDVFGKNPLFIFVLSGFLPRVFALVRWVDHLDENKQKVYTTPFNWFYLHICKNIRPDLRIGSLMYALCMIVFYWSIVYLLDKKKIYIKV